ncbi:MAG TPA: hypothetical protein VK582_05065, partial [Pyrinomonadaceae bacterium]|nr:hypothetical protein [Pyrinomonadaceae bacterium]
ADSGVPMNTSRIFGRGLTAAQCGKALPYRVSQIEIERGDASAVEAQPLSISYDCRKDKAFLPCAAADPHCG